MNAEEMLDEVVGIVLNPYSDDREDYLKYLNRANVILASRFLLPGLGDGNDTVDTATDSKTVALPDDYGRELFLALVEGKEVSVVRELRSLSILFGGLSLDSGTISAVTASNGNLVYQRVPDTVTEVDLFYYRNPVPMEDSTDSNPDGFVDDEDLDNALINYACWQAFAKLEQGVEGRKVSTEYHLGAFKEHEAAVKLKCYREGEQYASPPPANKAWV